MAEVKLHGAWPSPVSYRVICTLKLKGIRYEYIEEDLSNKSALLLQNNPVHKRIPLLVNGRKPICESMIILEYIEEAWPQSQLLLSDPYDKAIDRFWIKFVEEKGPTIWFMFRTSGEEQEKARKDCFEMLKTVEEIGLGEKKTTFFGRDQISLVDIAFGCIAYWLRVIEEIVGLKVLDAEKFPRLHEWIQNFTEVPIIKENLPDRDEMFIFFKRSRERLLSSS